MKKNKNTEQLREEFIAIYDKNLKRYGPDWFTFDDENKKELWEFVDKALSQKGEEVRREAEEKSWEMCRQIEKRIQKWETTEGFAPISAVDVINIRNNIFYNP